MSSLAQKLAIRDGWAVGILPAEGNTGFPDVEKELKLGMPMTIPDEAEVVIIPAVTESVNRRTIKSAKERLRKATVVWICYKKGNAAEINRDKLWIVMADYNWKAVSPVSLNSEWSALRVRPMMDKEEKGNA